MVGPKTSVVIVGNDCGALVMNVGQGVALSSDRVAGLHCLQNPTVVGQGVGCMPWVRTVSAI